MVCKLFNSAYWVIFHPFVVAFWLFKKNSFRNWTLSACQMVWIIIIWIQTVCKGYQQMTKVAANQEICGRIWLWAHQTCSLPIVLRPASGALLVRWKDLIHYCQKPPLKITVNVLKFWTQVASQKGLDKQCRPWSDYFFRSSLIRVFHVCYSDKHFVNFSHDNPQFLSKQQAQSVWSFRTFTVFLE